MNDLYADVILPLAFGSAFTYAVPAQWADAIKVGCRVEVPLASRSCLGVVCRLHHDKPTEYALKDIAELIDKEPLVLPSQLTFWQWISDYYLCTPGEVMKAALPSGLKVADAYRPKTETYLRLPAMADEAWERSALASLSRSPRQSEVFRHFLSIPSGKISRTGFMEQSQCSAAVLKQLLDKGLVEACEVEVSRLHAASGPLNPLNALSAAQEQAFQSVVAQWEEHDVCLLHGVTSSGKTEIYIHLIERFLDEGKQVLYLLPEISLTTQMTSRLSRVFGDRMLIYHSKFSDNERAEIWNRILKGTGPQLIVGVRSAVFLPFTRLGLVVVDEEHEISFKQQEPAPRYHARNAALVLARMFGAKAVLGSATPSVESYNKAQEGKYGLVRLTTRYRDVQLPRIEVADMRELRRRKLVKGPFSPILLEHIRQALDEGEQVILFQNRRGYAPVISCRDCGWTPKCKRCDVGLTLHKQTGRLRCHYCGQTAEIPDACPECHSKSLEICGFGTEKVEEELALHFPDARVARMDTDTMQNRHSYEQLIDDFENGRIDILVGTQMLTKGLDFDHVRVVGILNADQMMNMPDFRSHERAYQLMTQVSGRAGRKGPQGIVVVQSSSSDRGLIDQVTENDYKGLYVDEMQQRHAFGYPPYTYLIDIWLKHRDSAMLTKASDCYASWLRQALPDMVFGPFSPAVSRVKNIYIRKITLKVPPAYSLKKIKTYLCTALDSLHRFQEYRQVQVFFDVDPL